MNPTNKGMETDTQTKASKQNFIPDLVDTYKNSMESSIQSKSDLKIKSGKGD